MLFFPIVAFYTVRYQYIIKPLRLEQKKKAEEDLLAEGKFEQQ